MNRRGGTRPVAPGNDGADGATSDSRNRTGETRRMRAMWVMGTAVALLLVSVLGPVGAEAQAGQGGGLGSQSLRPYGHVFVAYALAWALILGWVVSLGRRWRRVEDELGRNGSEE